MKRETIVAGCLACTMALPQAAERIVYDFDRPELSRILDGVKDEVVAKPGRDGVPSPSAAMTVGDGTPTLPKCRGFEAASGEKYQEALAIIQKGAARLKATPRGDVEEGFTPCAKDREREARSERRRAEERRVYDAIRADRKVYDEYSGFP